MTGFGGHMTSVNFMNVHLEEPPTVEDDGMELNALSPFTQIPDISVYLATRGDNGDKRNGRKRPHKTDLRVRGVHVNKRMR